MINKFIIGDTIMTDPKDYLRQMIDHTIDGNAEAASDAFKQFLIPKTMEVLGTKPHTGGNAVPSKEAPAENVESTDSEDESTDEE